jgi:hypothetical protein
MVVVFLEVRHLPPWIELPPRLGATTGGTGLARNQLPGAEEGGATFPSSSAIEKAEAGARSPRQNGAGHHQARSFHCQARTCLTSAIVGVAASKVRGAIRLSLQEADVIVIDSDDNDDNGGGQANKEAHREDGEEDNHTGDWTSTHSTTSAEDLQTLFK